MELSVLPLTPDLWPALEDLFGPGGASNGCWCMYWRIGPAYGRRPRGENRADFEAVVERGPPPGLLAFDGERSVGWCQLTPRRALAWLERRRAGDGEDAAEVWSISCFYIRRGYRGRGVSSALIRAAVKAARTAGAAALEAYPVDPSRPDATRNVYTGVASSFVRAGFKEVSRGPRGRLTMRL
jgi:GNAT superfamily N-acetyltransferase